MTPEGPIELARGVSIDSGLIEIEYVRASGPGGQNVNKRSTKCRVRIPLAALPMDVLQLARLRILAGDMIVDSREIVVACDEFRSQAMNFDGCIDRIRAMVLKAMVEPKVRRATKPSRGSKERRLRDKKTRGDIKKKRRGGEGE